VDGGIQMNLRDNKITSSELTKQFNDNSSKIKKITRRKK